MGVSVGLLFFCVGVVLLQTVVSQDRIPIVSRRQRTDINKPGEEVFADPSSFSCGNISDGTRFACGSCTNVMICNYQKQAVGSYDCSSIDPANPYCEDGKCTNETDCKIKSDLCPATDKFYPVPNNCSEAVYCGTDYVATTYTSPSPSYMFDIATQSWVFRKTPADCFQINCATAANMNKFFAYKPNPQLYVYCGTSGPLTFQCDDNNVYNESTKRCEFGCIKEGKFPIAGEPTKFYSCLVGPNGTLQKFEESCPIGTEFNPDPAVLRCVIKLAGSG
uniref:Chitin-binding type-2 domain-containing protein n=1 Tax=Anopheles funestus TaxID=62324 RepID=A0A182R905_ANOFN